MSFKFYTAALEISITDFCNLSCPYCSQGTPLQKDKKIISYEELERISKLIKPYEFYCIKISGGEPTLHPEFKKICLNLKNLFPAYRYELATNGALLEKYLDVIEVFDEVQLSHYPGFNDNIFFPLSKRKIPNVTTKLKKNNIEMKNSYQKNNLNKNNIYYFCDYNKIKKIVKNRIYQCCIIFEQSTRQNIDREKISAYLDENWRENLQKIDIEEYCKNCFVNVEINEVKYKSQMKYKQSLNKKIIYHYDNLIHNKNNRLSNLDLASKLEFYKIIKKLSPSKIFIFGEEIDEITIKLISTLNSNQLELFLIGNKKYFKNVIEKTNELLALDNLSVKFLEKLYFQDYLKIINKRDKILLIFNITNQISDIFITDYLNENIFKVPNKPIILLKNMWYSKQSLKDTDIENYFKKKIIKNLDILIPQKIYFAPYFKEGTILSFKEILLDFINTFKIEINNIDGSNFIWFELSNNSINVDKNNKFFFKGYYDYHPFLLDNFDFDNVDEKIIEYLISSQFLYNCGKIEECLNILLNIWEKICKNEVVGYALSIVLAKIGKVKEAYTILSQIKHLLPKNNEIINLFFNLLENKLQVKRKFKKNKRGLTIFCIPKAFAGLNEIIQYNAINSWTQLEPKPEIILMGKDKGVKEFAQKINAKYIPDIETNEFGTPLVDDIFYKAWDYAENDVLMYINSDIILLNNFIEKIFAIHDLFENYLIIGERIDLFILEKFDFSNDRWKIKIQNKLKDGIWHGESGLDYFIHPRGLWGKIPPFAIGRTAWDNWLVKAAKVNDNVVLDATNFITAIHQEHDWGHCIGGKDGAWNGIEAQRNRFLAGYIDNNSFTTGANLLITKNGKIMLKNKAAPRCEEKFFIENRKKWIKQQLEKIKTHCNFFLFNLYNKQIEIQ